MIKRNVAILLSLSVVAIIVGCAPTSFVKTSVADWKTVEFRPNLERESAWRMIADTLAKNYDIEVIDKDSGYIRTAWMHTTTGKVNERYRTRIISKIPLSDDRVEIKTEAHWLSDSGWVAGYDTIMMDQVYSDIQGSVGRVTR